MIITAESGVLADEKSDGILPVDSSALSRGTMEEQSSAPANIFFVPDRNLSKLQDRVGKLARRAVKLGLPAPGLDIVGSYDIEFKEKDDFGAVVRVFKRYHVLRVVGEAPKIAGWQFVATLEAQSDDEGKFIGNMLRIIPTFEGVLPTWIRTAGAECSHCKVARRRNETFILLSDAGEFRQVGRQCLRDFLGHTSPEAFAKMAEMLLDIAGLCDSEEDDFGGGHGGERFFSTEEILALGACEIRLNGFRSNKTAREFGGTSTSSTVSEWVFDSPAGRAKWEKKLIPTDADTALAAKTFEWMQSLQDRTDVQSNDYLYNLSIASRSATLTTRAFGIVISAIASYAREQEFEINRRKQFESEAASKYVGEVGKRSTFENLTLVLARVFESNYGPTFFYKFKDVAGNVVVWFSSNPLWNENKKQDIEAGDVVTLVARVKAHEVRKSVGKNQQQDVEVKQTVITRASFPKPPKAPLTKEQKAARKAIKLARSIEFRIQEANRHKCSDWQSIYEACQIMRDVVSTLESEQPVS